MHPSRAEARARAIATLSPSTPRTASFTSFTRHTRRPPVGSPDPEPSSTCSPTPCAPRGGPPPTPPATTAGTPERTVMPQPAERPPAHHHSGRATPQGPFGNRINRNSRESVLDTACSGLAPVSCLSFTGLASALPAWGYPGAGAALVPCASLVHPLCIWTCNVNVAVAAACRPAGLSGTISLDS